MSIRIGMCHIGLRLQALLGRQNRKDRTSDAPGLKLNIPLAVRSIWFLKVVEYLDGRCVSCRCGQCCKTDIMDDEPEESE